MYTNPEKQNRLEKLAKLKELGYHPYPAKFNKTSLVSEITQLEDTKPCQTAGRLMTLRDMGKICFAHIQDESGRAQVVFQQDEVGKDVYKTIVSLLDLGDHIGVSGEIFTTKKGEKSLLVKEFSFLGKALLPLPEKFHGLSDQETAYRQRYLDVISNEETRKRFIFRSNLIKALRQFYWDNGFMEVETPTLLHKATGANAQPYHTHNNALDMDIVLRISHELPLKEIIVAGYDKVFELGKAFRNEGQDPSHLPEHTHLEHYAAYWDYQDNIAFTEKMFEYLFDTLALPKVMNIKNKDGELKEVDWSTPWKKINYIDLVNKDSGLDILSYTDADALRKDLKKKKIEFDGMESMGLSTLIDYVYKKVSRPKLINPTILYNYPKSLQPLARVNDENNAIVDQFQLVVNGWEILKAYSELVDPVDQRARFEEQSKAKSA
ncbi:lysine--tRNA ligase, partial [Candidatus Falkowbacteria bacterium]|nr:lysine--tRNA ligase [Candidatus Falkowbacteria bacterium]